jgi:HSP20 family protein
MFFATNAPGFARRPSVDSSQRMLERALAEAGRMRQTSTATVEQEDAATTLIFDVPGVARDQLSIGIEGNVVRIQSLEGAPRSYKMAYELPQDIEVASSTAKLENGVLTVRLVKQVPVSRVTELAIH